MKKLILSAVCGCVLLAGCATDPYTGESRASRTAIGAGVGTAAGAGIGARIGGKKGALIGAGAGAVVGTGTGAYMDIQAKRLREELVSTGVQVVQDQGKIYLIMPGNITFNTNEDTLKASFEPVLNSVAKVIKEYNKTLVMVNGYTDNTGTDAINNTLSFQRANTVANYLRMQGVSADRLMTQGHGSKNPIASNATAAGRAQHRRVEIVLVNRAS